jgi:hypothetical protein
MPEYSKARAKYVIRASRYIDGVYVAADPMHPAIIELPEGSKLDPGLFPVGDPRGTEAPKPHYVPSSASPVQKASAFFGPEDAKPPAETKQGKGKRDADKDVA